MFFRFFAAFIVAVFLVALAGAQTFSAVEIQGLDRPKTARLPDRTIILAGTLGSTRTIQTSDREENASVWIRKLTADGRRTLFTREFDGQSWDSLLDLEVGADGSLYLLVETISPDFPTTPNALESTRPDAAEPSTVLIQLDSDGELLLSTYLLTSAGLHAYGLAQAPDGDLLLTGVSRRNALSSTAGSYRFEREDAFWFDWVTLRLSPSLENPSLETRWVVVGVGGAFIDTDAEGNVFVLGTTGPEGYPVTDGAFQQRPAIAYCRGLAGIPCPRQRISKLTPDGAELTYSTFVTSGREERPTALIVDDEGRAHLVGTTTAEDYPTTEGAFQRVNPSRVPGFRQPWSFTGYATALNSEGTGLVQSTYFGGAGQTNVRGAALASDGRLVIAGDTSSIDFPAAPPRPFRCLPDDRDWNEESVVDSLPSGRREQSFVLELSARADRVIRSELIAGAGNRAYDVSLDADGRALVAGTGPLDEIPLIPYDRPLAEPDVAEPEQASRFWTYLAEFDLTAPRPSPALSCIAEPADYSLTTVVSPMRVLTLFGAGFGLEQPVVPDGAEGLPTRIGPVQALFDGTPAPLLFAKHDHLNLVVPSSVAGREATTLELRVGDEVVARRRLSVAARTPRVFVDPDLAALRCEAGEGELVDVVERYGQGPFGRILLPDGQLNECGRFARPGDVVALFVNGLGIAPGAPPDGEVPRTPSPLGLPVEVLVKGVPAPVEYAGTAVGQAAGIWQINFRMPDDYPDHVFRNSPFAALEVEVHVDGREADRVTVWAAP